MRICLNTLLNYGGFKCLRGSSIHAYNDYLSIPIAHAQVRTDNVSILCQSKFGANYNYDFHYIHYIHYIHFVIQLYWLIVYLYLYMIYIIVVRSMRFDNNNCTRSAVQKPPRADIMMACPLTFGFILLY